MRHATLYFTCGVCGLSTGTVDNDLLEEEDTDLPANWCEVVVRRVVANPDFVPLSNVDKVLAQLLSEIQVTPDDLESAKAALRPQAQMKVALEEAQMAPEVMIEEAQLHLCPEHTPNLFGLDSEAFLDADWELPEEPKEVERESA